MWFAAKTFIMIESSTTIYSGRQAFCLLLSMIGETFLLIVFPNSNNNSNQRAQTPPKPKSDPGFESGFPGYSGSGSGSWYLLPICFGFIRSVILWEMLINLLNPLFHNGERSGKVIRNPYPGPDHHQKLVTSRGSLLVPMPTMFSRRPLPRSWAIQLILLTDRQTEWQNDRSHYSASLGGLL